ncbi:MAG: spore germination protein, partial [Clostridia bacterium]|nr:spore germination protein [Clostridia bacterium]
NSPCAMIIETSFFDFIQNSNDYYFPPIIGSYLRYVRMIVFLLTMITTPLWYLFVINPQWIPKWLDFIRIEQPVSLPVIFQLLLVELVIDALKLASLNTPNSLNASFSVIGALVLGQFAVDAKWFVSEVVLYMAFVAVANYSQPSFELGYAFKFSRLFLLVMTAIFNIYGFVLALVIICVVISTTKTVTGKSYLYPLYPFDRKALKSLLIRGNIQNSKGQNEERKKS